jgi:hypothetical protein
MSWHLTDPHSTLVCWSTRLSKEFSRWEYSELLGGKQVGGIQHYSINIIDRDSSLPNAHLETK